MRVQNVSKIVLAKQQLAGGQNHENKIQNHVFFLFNHYCKCVLDKPFIGNAKIGRKFVLVLFNKIGTSPTYC